MVPLEQQSTAKLDRLYDDYWNFILKEDPRYATYPGDHRNDGELEDASNEGILESGYRRVTFKRALQSGPTELFCLEDL